VKIVGIIPARYASTRFPGKPLAPINGGLIAAALQGRDNKAQGNALGNKTTNRPSPEGAK
jgi:CMP-2-keto-3-deoxyoctulosonic acid synthetase